VQDEAGSLDVDEPADSGRDDLPDVEVEWEQQESGMR
jgi:hypothetical protein